MMFILTSLFKLCLFLLVITIIYEIGSQLIIYYYSLQLTDQVVTFQDFLSQGENALNMSIYYLHSLTLGEFKFVQLIVWAYLYHFYYLIIIFVFIIFYYEYRLKTITPPNLSKQANITLDEHSEQKKNETDQEVNKLINSPEYKAFQRGEFPYKKNDNED